MKDLTGEHAFVHENLGAYLAGGLEAGERGRFDAHINNCPECFDAFTEARDADRSLHRMVGDLVADGKLEETILEHVREQTMQRWRHPILKRTAYATAAAVALAATGVFANFATHQEGRFNNPLTRRLAERADAADPGLARASDWIEAKLGMPSSAANLRGITQSKNAYAGKTMAFQYDNATVDSILTDMSRNYGFIVVKSISLPQRVTVKAPKPVNADEAMELMNAALLTQGYGMVSTRSNDTADAKTIVRVASIADAKKAQIPVFEGGDPDKIPLTDNLITQVIPLKNVAAAGIRNDLLPMLSADADVATNAEGNALVVTDTSAKVHRLAEIVQKMDNQKSTKTVVEYRQLINSNAADAARLVNSTLNPATKKTAGTGMAGGGGAPTGVMNGEVYADSDPRTNTVVINGPADKVAQAVDMLNRIESIPFDRLSTSGDYESIQHRTGQEVMRQSIDSNEHLIPYADLMVYPDNWAEIQRKQVAGEGAESFATDDLAKNLANHGGVPVPSDSARIAGKFSFGAGVDSGAAQPTARAPVQPGAIAAWGGLPAATAAPAPGIGNGYLSYSGENQKSLNGKDVGFDFGLNADQRKNFEANRNSIAQSAGNGWVEGGYVFNQPGQPGTVAGTLIVNGTSSGPQVNISGGGGTGVTTVAGVDSAGKLLVRGNSTFAGDTSVASGTLNISGGTITNAGTGYSGAGTLTAGQSYGSLKTEPNATVLRDSGGDHATLANSSKPSEGPVNGDVNAPNYNARPSSSVLALNYKNNNLSDLPAANLGLDATTAARVNQPGTSQNGAQVGYGDAHAEFTRWYDIKDLDTFYEDTVKAPNLNLFAAATPITPPTPSGGSTAPGTAPRTTIEAPDPQLSLKIIRNGTIEFEVRSFDDTYQRVSEIAAAERGFVSSTSSDKLANGHVRGTIVVRIPPERLDRFLLSLRSLGDLKAQQIGAADVTKQYYDIESELRGLTTMETRLLDLIKNGKGEVKDLIEAEKQLGDTRVRIEKLKGEISYYNNLVSLATITITAFEKDIQSPTAASEQENVNLNVETEEVETKYQAARKILEDAKARIVESQLKNTDADHVAAHIVADVPPAQADFVANQLKQLGKVASFNRDRKQTTTGGTGAPIPGVQIDQKDTRVTLELFNLANLAPRETTVLRVAVKDVEGTYKNVLGLVKTPPTPAPAPDGAAAPAALNLTGRVISSNLNGQQPEQMSADIRAELRSDNADTIIAALRGSGEVLTSSLNTNQDNAGTTSAKRGLQVTLVNIASVNPKEADNLSIAVRDVDAAYKAALALIRKDAPPPAGNAPNAAALALLPATVGRVISSAMNGQQPVQMTADIRAEVRADQAAELLATLRGSGEIVSNSAVENPDTINVTRAKRGLAVHFVNVAAMDPREVQLLHGVAASVTDSYKALLTSLQEMAARGDVRIVGSALTDTDPRTVTARMTFEVQRPALDAVEKAFVAVGLEFPSRSTTRANDGTQTLDSKVGFQIADIRGAETLDPRRTITEGVEVDNVEKAVAQLRKSLAPQSPKVRESDFTVTRDAATGRVIAHIIYDTYVTATPTVTATIDALDGMQKSYQESRDPRAPETKSFTKERVDLTLTSRSLIVQPDQGIGSSLRAALSSAAGALLYSVYLVLTGLLFVLPFVVIVWPIWMILKRRKAAVKA